VAAGAHALALDADADGGLDRREQGCDLAHDFDTT